MDRKTKGIKAEELAKNHYIQSGGEIWESNYRFKRSEIDFITLLESRLLVFVEVKMRNRTDYGEAETFVSEEQKQRITEAAEDYIFAIDWQGHIRFDIVAVNGNGEIEVFEDAF